MRISDWSSDVCSSDLRGCGCWASIRWRTPMVEPQYRAVFDFEIEFTNGGGLRGHDFRLDIEGDDIGDAELVAHVVRDVRLLMVGPARLLNKHITTGSASLGESWRTYVLVSGEDVAIIKNNKHT